MATTYKWTIQAMDCVPQEDKSYTPYADLTQAEVVGWVQESLGKDTVEASLTTQIEAQKNPVTATGMPW